MRLSTADDQINEGEIVSWTGWLMDDDSFDEMVEEVRRRYPIKCRVPSLSLPLFFAAFLSPFVVLIACASNVTKSNVVWYFVLALVLSLVFCELSCVADDYELPEEDSLIRHRDDAMSRLRKIPFVVDYHFSRKLETSTGNKSEYYLSLSDGNNNEDLKRVLDVADIDFDVYTLPSKKKLTIKSRSAEVLHIAKGEAERPTIHVRINSWEEI